ncbi:MAG TPA: hypothetical protein VJ838_11945 [Gaiellaceae bacterium]|nr:hypothetical protein [Gaiellaceae bacterium]
MKRKIASLGAIAVGALAIVGTAAGSAPQVVWLGSNVGPVAYAEANWETRTATSITDAGVLAAVAHRGVPGTTGPGGGVGTRTFVDLHTMYLDGNGQPVGGLDVSGNADGVPFTIDPLNLTAASLNAVVPATTCTLDAAGNPTTCVDGGTLNVAASWTGQGGISKGVFYDDHFLDPGQLRLHRPSERHVPAGERDRDDRRTELRRLERGNGRHGQQRRDDGPHVPARLHSLNNREPSERLSHWQPLAGLATGGAPILRREAVGREPS